MNYITYCLVLVALISTAVNATIQTKLFEGLITGISKSDSLERQVALINLLQHIEDGINSMETKLESKIHHVVNEKMNEIQKHVEDYVERQNNLTQKLWNTLSNKINSRLLTSTSEKINVTTKPLGLQQLQRRSASIREEGYPSTIQANGCGGIVVAEDGWINFRNEKNNENESFECVWTIRSNRKSRVKIELTGDKLRNNFLILSEFKKFLVSNLTIDAVRSNAIRIESGDRKQYSLDGPIVFLTLVHLPLNDSNDSNTVPCSFNIYFEGSGNDGDSSILYTHYHLLKNQGSINYPQNGENYEPNEIVTFVVNSRTPFNAGINYVNIEASEYCEYDSLKILLHYVSATKLHYSHYGSSLTDYRMCGNYSVPQGINYPHGLHTLLLLFQSDSDKAGTGFNISWEENLVD